MNSRLRYVVSDRILTDEEMEEFFLKIDTDLDGSIQFEELENNPTRYASSFKSLLFETI